MSHCVLLVGEDQPLWQEFQAQATGAQSAWQAAAARTGGEALGFLEHGLFAAVVADAQLADMEGVALLDAVAQRRPQALRMVLSDPTDTERTVKCVGHGHHHLLRPCDADTLLHALDQALARETWLPSATVQGLIAQIRRVPSPPTVYFQVAAEMQSPDVSVERIGQLIAQDPAITAKVLQLANSAVFGLRLQVIHPAEAVTYIGLETTRTLVLLAHTFLYFDQLEPAGFSVESLWYHSVLCGRFARQIARCENSGLETIEQAFTAGLLHDIGKLLFAANLADAFGQALVLAKEQQRGLWEAESQVFGANHAELGACLLGIWGLPTPVVEAVALHHYPIHLREPVFRPLTAVHAADVLSREAWTEDSQAAKPECDLAYLQALGLDQTLESWRQACLVSAE